MATKILRCYIHGHGSSWEGLCIDLDIAVTGYSFEDVRNRLGQAITTYVQDALQEEPHVAARLMARKSPIGVRISYLARYWYTRAFGGRGDHDIYAGLDVPCPA